MTRLKATNIAGNDIQTGEVRPQLNGYWVNEHNEQEQLKRGAGEGRPKKTYALIDARTLNRTGIVLTVRV